MADQSRRSSRISLRSKQLGQLLLENGDIQAEQVSEALRTQESDGGLIGQVLQRMGACNSAAIAAALLKQVQITDIKCDELSPGADVIKLVTQEICESSRLCPFERMGNLLCVVMGNPLDRKAITQIEEKTRLKVKSFKAPWVKINDMIQRAYSGGGAAADAGGDDMSLEAPVEFDSPPLEPPSLDVSLDDVSSAPPSIPPPSIPSSDMGRRVKPSPAGSSPKISGIESLDETQAEVIETDRRGLKKRSTRADEPVDEAPKPRPEKKAKINVDLDTVDFSGGDVVAVGADDAEDGEEALEELAESAPEPVEGSDFVHLTNVDDSYFYAGGKAPTGSRAPELNAILGSLPVADVVAESMSEYQNRNRPKPQKFKEVAAANGTPIELQPVPQGVLAPVQISEAEFQKHIANLNEDPVGEWDWQYVACGPVPVQVYEEN